MTRKDLTEVVLIVDRSGSMTGVAVDMEGGMRELVKQQVEDEGQTNITYTRFDTEIEHVLDGVPSDEVDLKSLKLEPRGGTALRDGIGSTINRVGQRLANTPENDRPGLVIVVIVTDGGENCSKEYSQEQIQDMIKTQGEKYNWQFTFLGANQDSFAVGGSYGIDAGKISNYTMGKSQDVLAAGASSLVRSLKCASFAGDSLEAVGYTDEVKASLNDTSKNSS